MPFYITTPIYYVNARPHLGHAYTTIVADVVRRYHQMRAEEVFFLTGTDEHGDKVVRAAQKEGLEPRPYVDRISQLFRDLWPDLNVIPDHFIRTTDPDHMEVVRRVLQKIYDAGDIYFSEYEGLYCFGCERFYTERELVEGKCPDHRTEPEVIREANYFFRMSRYQGWLIDHIQTHPDFIRPERYRNEVLAFLREPLGDLCISRPKSRLTWGITLPFDERYVTYVWFDALLNYVSALGYPDGGRFHTFWPAAQHIVAKDILKPHGIYWPCMLKAAGIPVYRHLNVHGYWNVEQGKMSKSIGNVVEPLQMKDRYGLDAFRFFLVREMTFGLDSNFSEAALVQRLNADLANDLGNLFSRVVSMTHKYFGGLVPEVAPEMARQFGLGLGPEALRTVAEYEQALEGFELQKAMAVVWEFIGRMNKAVDVAAPWELAKKKATLRQLEAVMSSLLKGLRLISGLIYPVMPDTAGSHAEAPGARSRCAVLSSGRAEKVAAGPGRNPSAQGRDALSTHRNHPGGGRDRLPAASGYSRDQAGDRHRGFRPDRPARGHRGQGRSRSQGPQAAQAGDRHGRTPDHRRRHCRALCARVADRPAAHRRRQPETGQAHGHPVPGHAAGCRRGRRPGADHAR